MITKLVQFIETSFISSLLADKNITDISYNGVSLFYQHNRLGRKKANIKVDSTEATDFIRQVANMSEKQFSFTSPFLDISVDRYRINAVHSSLVRVGNEKSISFSIRIASYESRIKNDRSFMEPEAKEILETMLKSNESIVIAGPTGSGKTELQKYLLSSLSNNSRIIIIDNIQELDFIRTNEELDVTSWQVTPSSKEGTFEELIRNALRSNPDWLVIAESRGKEMNDVLNSVMTGHPIISTIHAKDVESVPHRMVRMVEMSETSEDYDEIKEDILTHIKCYVYVNKRIKSNGEVTRFIESIALANKDTLTLDVVYRRKEK